MALFPLLSAAGGETEFAAGKLRSQKSPWMAIFGRARDRSGNPGGLREAETEELERIARFFAASKNSREPERPSAAKNAPKKQHLRFKFDIAGDTL
jgi:hypothetical protein